MKVTEATLADWLIRVNEWESPFPKRWMNQDECRGAYLILDRIVSAKAMKAAYKRRERMEQRQRAK